MKLQLLPLVLHLEYPLPHHLCRVEASITNHLRYFVRNLEKYKVVYFFLVYKDRNQEDYKFVIVILLFKLKLL